MRDEIKAAGIVEGKHYTEHVPAVKALKRSGDYSAAIQLLLRLVDAVEAESRAAGPTRAVPPWYYEQLALLYRKGKNFQAEVDILRRYVEQCAGKREQPFPAVTAKLGEAEVRLARSL